MKFDLHFRLVRDAETIGVKPAGRKHGCSVKTVRKWLRRWIDSGRSRHSLLDRSRAPHSCPHKTPERVERQIVRERNKAPCLGARRLKDFCDIPASQGAIARVLRDKGLVRKRRKKHEKKRDMRAVKARFSPFEENQVDVKYLCDIPYYVEQTWRNPALPQFEYTWRDVKTGGLFLGFANELNEANACCFAAAVGAHLARTGFTLHGRSTVQTDNGSEFIGSWQAKKTSAFTKCIENIPGQKHHTIPPGAHTWQSGVETVLNLIGNEFFVIENFNNRNDFFKKAATYQLFFNVVRPNSSKENRTPWNILVQDMHNPNPYIPLLPPIDLDLILANKDPTNIFQRGNHVRPYP